MQHMDLCVGLDHKLKGEGTSWAGVSVNPCCCVLVALTQGKRRDAYEIEERKM